MTSAEQNVCFDFWMRDHIAILHKVSHGFAEGSDRQDLLQDLMLAVWRAVPSFRSQSSASTFIYRVSHNAAMTWKRSRRNYIRKMELFEAFQASEPASSESTQNELLDRIYTAIRLLPPLDRSLILLSLDSVSYRDMADLHGLSESNVGARLNRIRQKLSHSLKETSYEL